MFKLCRVQMLQCFLSSLLCFPLTAYADDLSWEEANWLGVQPDDVNPDINRWSTFVKPIITTVGGSASTIEQWALTDTSDLGMVPFTTTVNGQAQVTSTTQYVQFAASTVTQGGNTAVETSMLIAPAIWSDVADAASTACGGGTRKRQFCDLSKIDTDTLAQALYNTFAKKGIIMDTLAILGFIEIMQGGALNRPEANSWKITGILPSTPATSSDSDEAAATGWVDPFYTDEADLVSQFLASSGKSAPTSVAASTTTTSLVCSSTVSATVSPTAAYSNIQQFCGQQDHLVPINPAASTSQNFPGLDQNITISVSWAPGCNSNSPPYTLNSDDCGKYLNDTVDGCDNNSNAKHGGALTADCIVYAMTPQAFTADTTYDNPPPTPDPTVTQLSCASATPNAITFSQSDASKKISDYCQYLSDHKVVMSANSSNPNNPNGPSSGVTETCGATSNPISVSVYPSRKWTSKLL